MVGTWLLWLLGIASAVSGAAVLVMWRRQRRARHAASRRWSRQVVHLNVMPPTGLDEPPGADEPFAKICPACGCRYSVMYRTCARDDSELAAIH